MTGTDLSRQPSIDCSCRHVLHIRWYVLSSSRIWYQPKSYLLNYVICESFYLHSIAYSSLASNFEWRPEHLVQERQEWTCTTSYLGTSFAWQEAIRWMNHPLWFENAKILMGNPLCMGTFIPDAKRYALKSGFDNFDLCPTCYSCLIATFGYGVHFKETTYPRGYRLTAWL